MEVRGTRSTVLAATCVAMLAAGCAGGGGLRLAPASPHEQYADKLRSAGLDQTALGRDWTRAGSDALGQPVAIALPFEERGYFPPGEAIAVAYRLELQRGRRLTVTVAHDTAAPGQLFVDLFEWRPDGPRRVASMPAGATALTHEVERDGSYLLRLQPELLRGGSYVVTQRTVAAVRTFPVQGLTARAVQSGFGAGRDAGAREHEGIDIFAPRGTAVLAVRDGEARADTNALGGNVVWLRGGWDGPAYYYAHLDQWAFEGTRRVHEGDVLGFVGNTGNARTTAPHLHFGIYERGAIDPLPFVAPDDAMPAAAPADAPLGQLVRTRAGRTPLRATPAPHGEVTAQLAAGTVGRVFAASAGGWRLRLPDGTYGHAAATAVVAASSPLRRLSLPAAAILRERPDPQAPAVRVLEVAQTLDALGEFTGHVLLRDEDARLGWWHPDFVQKPSAPGPTSRFDPRPLHQRHPGDTPDR
jgi:murein DD-endopeptidase MepM/ murein hydrolase activator NlpD